MTQGSPVRYALAGLFVAVLGVYSVVWMYYIRAQEQAPAAGFSYEYRPSENVARITRLSERGPAAAAGLEVSDRISAVDGAPLTELRPLLDGLGQRSVGDVVTFTVEARDDQQARDVPVRLVRSSELRGPGVSIGLDGWSAGPALTTVVLGAMHVYPLVFLAVLAFVLLQRPDDRNAWAMSFAFAGFIAGAPLLQLEPVLPPPIRGFMVGLSLGFSTLWPATLYFFFAVFPEPSWLDRKMPWLKYLFAGFGALLAVPVFAGALWTNSSYPMWWAMETLGGPWQVRFLRVYSLAGVLLAIASLATNAFGSPETRRKTQVILAGTVAGLLPIVLLNIVLMVTAGPPERVVPFWMFAVAVLALSLVPLSIAYALVKHRVLELPVLFRRSARYLLVRHGLVTLALLVGLVCTFAVAALLEDAFPADPHVGRSAGLLLGAMFGGMLALTGHRAWRPAQERIDRAFFRTAYDARRILEQLAADSRTATDRHALAFRIEQALEAALHPRALHVYLRCEAQPDLLVAAGEDAETLAHLPLDTRTPCLARLADEGLAVTLGPDDLADDGDFAACRALEPEMLVPIAGRSGRLEGLLVLGPRLSEEPYSGEDRALLASAAAQAGLTLENIRLAETMAARLEAEHRQARELQIAKEVQAKLLPQQAPPVSTLDYAGACVQARQVGGDFYDFVRVGPERFGLVLADVSGKGMSAALMMASLQANLRAQFARASVDLVGTLRTLNTYFYESTAANHYATLFFGLFDERTRVLLYANCGHQPPILLRRDGTMERLSPTGPVVGLFEPWDAVTAETTIEVGDLLVVYSDGVTDAMNAEGEEFGEERLEALVRACAHLPIARLLETLLDAVREHDGEAQYDDVTLIVGRGR
jgi:phosphoserine phosphatase RsbU/P